MQEALTAHLLALAPLGDLGGRIHWRVLPGSQITLPYATLQQVTERRAACLDGDEGARETLIQIDVWAATYAQSRAIAGTLIDHLHLFRGPMGAINVQGIFIEAERDLDGRGVIEGPLFGRALDFSIRWGAS